MLLHFESPHFHRIRCRPSTIIGFTLEVMIRGKQTKPNYFILSACTEQWQPVERKYYYDFERPLRDAAMAGIAQHEQWKFTQPDRGCKLYSKPRTKVEIRHRKLKKTLARYLQEQALAKLTTPEKLFYITRISENEPTSREADS